MEARRLNNLKQEILEGLIKPNTTNQILKKLKEKSEYKFLSWNAVDTRLNELIAEGKIKVNDEGRTKVYWRC